MDNTQKIGQKKRKKGFSGLQVTGLVAAAVAVTAIVTLAAAWFYLNPRPFEPVTLDPAEQQRLEEKLARVEAVAGAVPPDLTPRAGGTEEEGDFTAEGRLRPEPYREDPASREISFSEREINAMLAANTDLADKLAIDLAADMVSARMLVPVDPGFPVIGGKILAEALPDDALDTITSDGSFVHLARDGHPQARSVAFAGACQHLEHPVGRHRRLIEYTLEVGGCGEAGLSRE